jgi:hypothetical protein
MTLATSYIPVDHSNLEVETYDKYRKGGDQGEQPENQVK